MFEGDGFGVGLTVRQLDVRSAPAGGWPAPEGVVVRPSRIGEVLPVSGRSGAQLAAELGRITAAKAQLAAYEAEVVCALAALRPDADDRRQGDPGAASPDWIEGPEHPPAGVGEFFVDELAMALGTSKTSAGFLWLYASTLCQRLPGTWAALADGRLDWPRGRAIAGEVAGVDVEPGVLAAVEEAVLPVAGRFTVTGLRVLVRAELLARDAAAADKRRRRAARAADARVTPTGDGRASFGADMSLEDAQACWEVADHYARIAKAEGDARPLGMIRAEVVRDLMLQPDDPDRPPITAHLVVHAPLDALRPAAAAGSDADHTDADHADGDHADGDHADGDHADGDHADGDHTDGDPEPPPAPIASVNGQPITAAHLRALLEALDALCPGGLQPPPAGSLRVALTDPDGALRAVVTRTELERLVRRGCPHHPPRDDGGPACGCGLVDRPPGVDRYSPSAPQYRFLRIRDRGCRMPGCTARAGWADLDHVIAHASGGATDCANLCCLCRRHHRLKTFAPGWTFRMAPDGTLAVTTPSGITRSTRPPGLHPPDEHPPDEHPPDEHPLRAHLPRSDRRPAPAAVGNPAWATGPAWGTWPPGPPIAHDDPAPF